MEKRTVTRTVKSFGRYDLEGPLEDAIATLQQYQSHYSDKENLRIDIDYRNSYYDSIKIEIELKYDELETDAEVNARKAREDMNKDYRRRQYESLKKEFG